MTEVVPVEGEEAHHGVHPHYAFLFVLITLLQGTLIRHLARRAPVPYTVILLVVGFIWGVLYDKVDLGPVLGPSILMWRDMDPHLLLQALLPVLIFESAYSTNWHVFKRSLPQVLLLAVPGLLIATFATAGFIHGTFTYEGWSFSFALTLGSLLSATDPVAVVALLKDLGASEKLGTIIEGESLLNDGTAIVIFQVFLAMMLGESPTGVEIMISFIRLSFGGIVFGLIAGFMATLWIGKVYNDPLVEVTITVGVCYLVFFIAETSLKVSGVLAVVCLGMVFAYVGKTHISPEVEPTMHHIWEWIGFVANTIIFTHAGVMVAKSVLDSIEASDYANLAALYIALLCIRFAMMAMLSPLLNRLGYGMGWRNAVVVAYGGLRGALALVLAMIVDLESGIDQSTRSRFLFFAAGIATLTLVVNATTTGFVLKALGLTNSTEAERLLKHQATTSLRDYRGKEMNLLAQNKLFSEANWDDVASLTKLDLEKDDETAPLVGEATPRKRKSNKVAPAKDGVDIDLESARGIASPSDHEYLNEARRRFLLGVKAMYWSQFEEGFLSRNGVLVLMASANKAMDCLSPLNEWDDFLSADCSIPFAAMKMAKIPGLKELVQSWLLHRLHLAVTVSSTFVECHRQVLCVLQEIVRDGAIASQIKIESEANVDKARAFLKDTAVAFPEIVAAIRTQQAAHIVLHEERKFISDLVHNGMLVEREASVLHEDVDRHLKIVDMAVPQLKAPTARNILRRCRAFGVLHDDQFAEVMDASEVQNHDANVDLVVKDGPCAGFFVIIKGFVRFRHEARDKTDFLGPGTAFGNCECLTGRGGLVTMTTDTEVELNFLPKAAMLEFANRPDFIDFNVTAWRLTGFHVSYLLLQDFFHGAYREVIRARISRCDPIRIQEGGLFHAQGYGILVQGQLERTDATGAGTGGHVLNPIVAVTPEMGEYRATAQTVVLVVPEADAKAEVNVRQTQLDALRKQMNEKSGTAHGGQRPAPKPAGPKR